MNSSMRRRRAGRLLSAISLVTALLFLISPDARGAEPTAQSLLAEALASAQKVEGPDRDDGFIVVAATQSAAGDVAAARKTAELVSNRTRRGFAYARIARERAMAGDLDGAKNILGAVGDPAAQANIYGGIVHAQALKGDIAAAKTTAERMNHPFYSAHASEQIALAQARTGDLAGAIATADAIDGAEDVRVEALTGIAAIQAKAGDAPAAKKMIELAKIAAKRVPEFLMPIAQAAIAGAQTRAGELPTALATVEAMKESSDRSLGFNHIAAAQIENADLVGAKSTLKKITSPGEQLWITLKIAEGQVKAGDRKAALESVAAVRAILDAKPALSPTAYNCHHLARVQAEAGDLAGAVKWARGQPNPAVRTQALCGVVMAMVNAPKQ